MISVGVGLLQRRCSSSTSMRFTLCSPRMDRTKRHCRRAEDRSPTAPLKQLPNGFSLALQGRREP